MLSAEANEGFVSHPVRTIPVLHVLAATAEEVAELCRLLEAAGARGLTDLEEPADGVLVVVESVDTAQALTASLCSEIAPCPGPIGLVALAPGAPVEVSGQPVLPAYVEGALAAWLSGVFDPRWGRPIFEELRSCVGALLEADPHGVVIVDGHGKVLATNEGAKNHVCGLREGAPFPHALPPERTDRVVEAQGAPVVVSRRSIQWGRTPAQLVLLRPASGSESFEGRWAHADRLVAVGALAAGFAHEVNNPAQSLTANLAELTEQLQSLERGVLLALDGFDDETAKTFEALGLQQTIAEARDLVQESFDGLGRIAGIVRDMKSFSRIQADRVDWVHPNEIVNQACSIANNHIRHRARLVKDLRARCCFPGDRNKLVQVVTNLLVNAAQALPEGAEDGRVLVRTSVDDGRAVISVVDNGTGIEPEVLRKIFEPFFTTKVSQDGTGLGLALSLDIARQHGGTLEVETEFGRGSRFDLIVPLENGLVAPVRLFEPRTTEILQTGRVLIIDDEPGILRSLGRLIGRRHETKTAIDGAEALDILSEDETFDIILCDLQMPNIDGPTLYEALMARAPNLARRMVFMSGGAFTERAQKFLDRVKPMVLDKPAPAAALEQAIQQVMAMPEDTAELVPPESEGARTRSFP